MIKLGFSNLRYERPNLSIQLLISRFFGEWEMLPNGWTFES